MCKNLFMLLLIFLLLNGCERPTDNDQADDGVPPAVPANFSVYNASDGEVIIEWQSNNEPDLEGYNIYRKTNKVDYSIITFTTNDFYIDDSLEYNETYYYKISAQDIWGRESMTAQEVSAEPVNRFSPRKPRGLEINGKNWEGEISISLNWQPNFETDMMGYNIYRSDMPSFQPDDSSFIDFSENPFFTDSSDLLFFKNYYYKIKAADKGGLLSDVSHEIYDQIFEIPEMIFPNDNTQINFFNDFIIKAIPVPADYEIIVQTNQFFGEFWRKEFFSSKVNDTIRVEFDPPFIDVNKKYYWRVITYSGNSSEPNSISKLQSFIIKE